jgi:DNA-damage-inducible protein J
LPFALTKNSANDADYDIWFRAKVQEALNDTRSATPHKNAETHFAKRRSAALRELRSCKA